MNIHDFANLTVETRRLTISHQITLIDFNLFVVFVCMYVCKEPPIARLIRMGNGEYKQRNILLRSIIAKCVTII